MKKDTVVSLIKPVLVLVQLFVGVHSDDGAGRGAYSGAEDAGPVRSESAFHVCLVAAVFQADGECGECVAVVVFKGDVYERHECGPSGVAGGAGEGVVGGDGESLV